MVFIVHSLGGLVIKQVGAALALNLLVLSSIGARAGRPWSGFQRYPIIYSWYHLSWITSSRMRCCCVWCEWLAQAARHDKTLLESLKRNSPALFDIARDFEAGYGNADIVCFCEDKDAFYGPWQIQICLIPSLPSTECEIS